MQAVTSPGQSNQQNAQSNYYSPQEENIRKSIKEYFSDLQQEFAEKFEIYQGFQQIYFAFRRREVTARQKFYKEGSLFAEIQYNNARKEARNAEINAYDALSSAQSLAFSNMRLNAGTIA